MVGSILEFFFRLTESIGFPSYAVALLLLTVIIKLVLFPLNKKQMESMAGMQEAQPKIAEIQKKYANNQQKQADELMKIYKEYKINPLSGCLPMLIQMPIFIILFNGIRDFVPLHPEYFTFFWIDNLAEVDKTYILAILMAIFTFLQSYITSGKPKDPMMKVMIYGMPLMMLFWGVAFPAGLCLYWIGFSIMGCIQQLIIRRSRNKLAAEKAAASDSKKGIVDVKAKGVSNGKKKSTKGGKK